MVAAAESTAPGKSMRRTAAHRVCELLLGGPPLWQKERESLTRMRGEVASRSGNLRGTGAMNKGDGQIAQCGHDLRSRARAQARAIFAKGDIVHRMETVLDAPMASRQIEGTTWTGLNGREVRDEVDHPPSVVLPVLCTVTVRVKRATD